MSEWELMNVVCRLAVAGIVVIKLVFFYDSYRWDERLGLGIAGGCALLTMVELGGFRSSPFDHWPSAFFAFGVMVYFVGRLRRQIHHRRANNRQIRAAQRHFQAKGNSSG
jgi:hypothetical protein